MSGGPLRLRGGGGHTLRRLRLRTILHRFSHARLSLVSGETRGDLQLADAQIRVLSKGNKQRLLPLPSETIQVLQNYLRLERPLTNSPALDVLLWRPGRGSPARGILCHPAPTAAAVLRF